MKLILILLLLCDRIKEGLYFKYEKENTQKLEIQIN